MLFLLFCIETLASYNVRDLGNHLLKQFKGLKRSTHILFTGAGKGLYSLQRCHTSKEGQ